MENSNEQLIDSELEVNTQPEKLTEHRFDKELLECLTFLGLALLIAVIGVRSLIWAIEFILSRIG